MFKFNNGMANSFVDYCLIQSADISLWAVPLVPALRLVSSFLQAVASHSPHKSVSGLYIHIKLRAHVNWQYLSHCFWLAAVSTTAFIGDSSVEFAQLWAHLCRLSLDTVRRNECLGWNHQAIRMMRLSQSAQVSGLDIQFSEWWADILMPMGVHAKSLQRFCAPVISGLQ